MIPGGLEAIALGQLGMDWIDNTNAVTGTWCIITALTDTVFNVLTVASPLSVNGTAGSSLGGGKALTAGKSIYGQFTAITLTSGSVVAYRHGG